MNLLPLIIELVSGAIGGNVAGGLLKNLSLGPIGNSIANLDGITLAPFFKYAANVAVYKCPADNYVSPAQAAAGITARPRSYSMNMFFGVLAEGLPKNVALLPARWDTIVAGPLPKPRVNACRQIFF